MKMTMTQIMTKTKSCFCLLHMLWSSLVGDLIDVDNDQFTRPGPIYICLFVFWGKSSFFRLIHMSFVSLSDFWGLIHMSFVSLSDIWGLIQETDRLLGQQYNDDTGYYDTVKVSSNLSG